MIIFPLEYVVSAMKKGRIVLWAEAAEAAARTTARIIQAVIRIPEDPLTGLPVRLIDLQVLHTDLQGLLIRIIQGVHTDQAVAEATEAGVSAAVEAEVA